MSVKSFLIKHGGDVAVISGIAGFVGTVVFATKAAPKAKEIINDYELSTNEKAKFKDKFKLTWKVWVPTAVTGALSTAAIVGGVIIKNNKASILTTALASSQAAMTTYQKAVIDKIGVDAEREIHQQAIQANPQVQAAPTQALTTIADEDTEVNCWDGFTQTPFKSSVADLKMWCAEANQRRLTGSFDTVFLSEYFDKFGIRESSAGDKLYWDLDNPVELYIDSILVKGKSYIYVEPRGYKMEA